MVFGLSAWPALQQNSRRTGLGPVLGPNFLSVGFSIGLGTVTRGGCAQAYDGTLLVGGEDAVLRALDPHSGAQLWTYTASYPIYGVPAIYPSDGTIYIGADGVVAIDPTTHATKWNYGGAGVMVLGSPAIGDTGTVYATLSTPGGWVLAALTAAGQLLWTYNASAACSSPSVDGDGTIYFGTDDGKLYAINSDGTLRFVYALASGLIRSAPMIGPDGTVYLAVPGLGKLVAFNPSTQSVLWTYGSVGVSITMTPALGLDGTIYAGFFGLSALTPSGQLKWSTSGVNAFPTRIAVALNGAVYFATEDSRVFGYDANGVQLFATTASTNAAPMFGYDGSLYFSLGASSLECVAAPPATPLGLTLTGGLTQINASWIPVSGATNYAFQVRDVGSGQLVTPVITVNVPGATATLTGLPAGATYDVQIASQTSAGQGWWSTPHQIALTIPVPAGVSAHFGSGGIVVRWNPVPGATGYAYTVTDLSTGLLVTVSANFNPTQTSATLTGPLAIGTTYGVQVATLVGSASSQPSASVSVTIPSVLYVRTTGSDTTGDGSASLPWATVAFACAQATDGEIVDVGAGTFVENVTVPHTLTLRGAGLSQTVIDGNLAGRAIAVSGAVNVSITGMQLRRGVANGTGATGQGGGVYAPSGSLSLSQCLVSDNAAVVGAALYCGGALTLSGCELRNNTASGDGALYLAGASTSTIDSCVIDANSGQGTAGIFVDGSATLTVRTSLFTGNTATSAGAQSGTGAALTVATATLALVNCTISGNTVTAAGVPAGKSLAAALAVNAGAASLNACTVAYNNGAATGAGGLVNAAGTVTLANTIVGRNVGQTAADLQGAFASQDYNLIEAAGAATFSGPTANNLLGFNPVLSPLADHGGATLTHALLPGSPAIQMANPAAPGSSPWACPLTDERGITRPQAIRCDIGAYEEQSPIAALNRTFVFDDLGRLTSVTDQYGNITRYTYDATPTGNAGNPSAVVIVPR